MSCSLACLFLVQNSFLLQEKGLECVQRRAMELGKALEKNSGEERLRELGRICLEKRRLKDFSLCLTGGCSEVGDWIPLPGNKG